MHKRTRQQVERKRRIAALQATPPPIDHPLSSADIAELQKQLYGPIVLPTDPTYDLCRQLSNRTRISRKSLSIARSSATCVPAWISRKNTTSGWSCVLVGTARHVIR
jgi:hypothetical protein